MQKSEFQQVLRKKKPVKPRVGANHNARKLKRAKRKRNKLTKKNELQMKITGKVHVTKRVRKLSEKTLNIPTLPKKLNIPQL